MFFFPKLLGPPNQEEWRKLPLRQSNHLLGYKPSSRTGSGRILLASDYTLVCQEKNLDWMVGVGKGMKMAAQEKGGGGSRRVLSPLDLHRWHAGENKCYKDFDNVLIMQPHCQHAICIIPSHRDAPKLPEDIWVLKHGHSSFISK